MTCLYCDYEIEHDEPGWGWFEDSVFAWHTECMEMLEGVSV